MASLSERALSRAAAGVLLAALLVSALVYGRIIIDGDGLSYYALTLSLARDHDFDLQNQKQDIQGVMAPRNEVTGKPASLFSCGFGVLYAPALLLMEQIPMLAAPHPYPQNTRIPFAHALAVFAQSVLFGFGAVLLATIFAQRKLALSPLLAAFVCLAAFAGTPLLFYTVTMPSYAHAADAFLTTAIFALALRTHESPWRCLLTGLLLSLSVLLRNNNLVFWPVAVAAVLHYERSRRLRALLLLAAGALPFAMTHAGFNLSQYGKLLTTGYRVQTETGFLSEMLFHPYAGIFVWAPITVAAAVGLIAGAARRRPEAIVSLAAVALVFLSVQFQGNWWGGCSFGPRFFTHLFFFWVVGLSVLASWKPAPMIGFVAVAALWTFFLFNVHLVNAGSVEGRKALNANNCRRTPLELISTARENYVEDGAAGWFSYWQTCLSARPYPTILFLLHRKEGMQTRED